MRQRCRRREVAALAVKTESQVTGDDTYIYAGLARIYRDLNQPNIDIKYYKDSINEIEEVRRGIQGLPPELQKSLAPPTFALSVLGWREWV